MAMHSGASQGQSQQVKVTEFNPNMQQSLKHFEPATVLGFKIIMQYKTWSWEIEIL